MTATQCDTRPADLLGFFEQDAVARAIALDEDVYRRTDDGWRLAARRISALTPPQRDGFDA